MNWSWRLGQWFGVEVRVHWTLLAYCLVLLVIPLPSSGLDMAVRGFAIGVLFGSVLLHEFGHSFAGRLCEGEADRILMWPLGGLAFVRLPDSPAAHFLTALAGPLVSLILWAAAVALASLTSGWTGLWLDALAQMNLRLVLFNLIPAFPMDGGRMLQAWLWRGMGFARSMWICVHLAMGVAVLLFIASFINPQAGQINLLLTAVAVFVFFEAWKQRQLLAFEHSSAEFWSSRPGVAWNHPYRTTAETKPGLWRRVTDRWRGKTRHAVRSRRELSPAEFMREKVDPILDKISREGMQSLTRAEREILDAARDLMEKKPR